MVELGDLIGTDEVARVINRSRATVIDLVKRGELVPVIKAPGRTGAHLFDPAKVAAYVEWRDAGLKARLAPADT